MVSKIINEYLKLKTEDLKIERPSDVVRDSSTRPAALVGMTP